MPRKAKPKRKPTKVALSPKDLRHERFINLMLMGTSYPDIGHILGYSQSYCSKLGATAKVQTELAIRRKDLARRHEVTVERVLEEVTLLAFSNIADLAPPKGINMTWDLLRAMPNHVTATIKSVKVTPGKYGDAWSIQLCDKERMLEKLLVILGLLKDLEPFEQFINRMPAENRARLEPFLRKMFEKPREEPADRPLLPQPNPYAPEAKNGEQN